MHNRLFTWTVVVGVIAAGSAGFAAQNAVESPETAQAIKFLQGLRERGYHDVALDYLNELRSATDTPADLKAILDYEEGRGLLEEATRSGDLEGRRKLLDEARIKLDTFAKNNPNHALAAEALVQSARLLFERGQTAVLQANELKSEKEAALRIAEARASFEESRAAYGRAITPLKKQYDTYPAFIPEDDPRRAEKQRVHIGLMNAELQRALVEYEEAQTFPPGDAKRAELLNVGLAAFDDIYKRYRTQLAGFFARMWQAKCYEEQGKLTEAMGIYKELMEHGDPALAPLQRKVQYFQIIVDGKRKEHALAVDRAADWLKHYPSFQRSDEGIGVKLELAKNILAQLETLKDSDRPIAINRATDLLTEVVRYYSSFKPEALALLRKYKPKAANSANNLADLSYEDAFAQGEGAISTHEWDRAVALFKHAIDRADPRKDVEKANLARHMMAYAYYEAERYYSAAVIAEHLARNYPSWSHSVKAAEIGIASLTQAYNAYLAVDRSSDLDALADLCKYTTATWPESDQADSAWMTLGQINLGLADKLGRANYVGAYQAFESIRDGSPKRLDAMVLAANAHRRNSYYLRDDGKTAEADAEMKRAFELLEGALKSRRDAGTAMTDPAFISNANALADLDRETGKPKDAIALLEPIAKALSGAPSGDLAPLHSELLTIMLRSHIADGQADAAIADMKALEAVSDTNASLNQLYFELGRTLKKELEGLQAKKYTTKLNQTRTAYAQFLDALANSKSGQTFDTLLFAAGGLLELGQAPRATALFRDILKKYGTDKEFLKKPEAENRLTIVRLRLAESLRKEKKFTESQTVGDEVRQLAPTSLEPLFEEGLLYEDWAATDKSKWPLAYNHWRQLSSKLERTRPRRIEYYDALLHVAKALEGLGKKADAAALLKSVMTLSPAVGNPEYKAKFQATYARLTGK